MHDYSPLAISIPIATLIWASVQFLLTRSSDAKNRQFEAYHRLIKEIVQPSDDGKTYLHRQGAAIFELRRFKSYREVTARLLSDLMARWKTAGKLDPLIETEIKLTLRILSRRHGIGR